MSCAPSTRIGVPFTSTCRTPVGSSAVSRSASAGKSRTRRVGPGPTVCGIEHAHVGPVALAQVAAPHEAEHVGRLAGELAHRRLERHAPRSRTQVPSRSVGSGASHSWSTCAPASESPSATCSCVSRSAHRVDVVVGDVRAEARRRGPRRPRSRTSRRAGRRRARAARSITRRPSSSGNRADSETSKVSQRGFIGECSRSAAAARPPRRIAVRRECAPPGSPSSARRTPCRC